MTTGKLIRPLNYEVIDGAVIFLGSTYSEVRWQLEAVRLLHQLAPELHIAFADGKEGVSEEDLLAWESFYLKRASEYGAVLYWFPSAKASEVGIEFERAAFLSLGLLVTRHEREDLELVVGIEAGYPGVSAIQRMLSQGSPGLSICGTLRESCQAIVLALLQRGMLESKRQRRSTDEWVSSSSGSKSGVPVSGLGIAQNQEQSPMNTLMLSSAEGGIVAVEEGGVSSSDHLSPRLEDEGLSAGHKSSEEVPDDRSSEPYFTNDMLSPHINVLAQADLVEHRENYSAAEAMRQTGDFRESIGSSEIIYRPVSSEPSALDKPLDRVHNAAESRFHSRDLLAPPIDEPEITELASATTPESTGSARVEQRVGQHSGRDGSGRDISLSGWEDDTSAKASKSQLSLSDEFFMDDLNYRPRSRLKQVMLWLLIGGMFAVGGFIGVKWYSAQHQVDTQKGSSDISQVATKQRDVPSVETQPSAIKTDQAISMQVPDGGQDVPDSVDTVRASPPVERIYLNSPNAQTSAVKPRPEPRPVGAEPKTKRRLAQPVAGGATINQVDYLLKLAMQHRKAERLAQAESLLRRALSMRPKQPAEVLSALGQVLYERDKTSAALNYLLKAYNIDPRSTGDGLFFLGGIYYSQNKSDKASTFFRAYLNYFPNGKHARDARIMLKK